MYIYMYVHIYIHVYIHIYAYMYVYMYVCMYICLYVFTLGSARMQLNSYEFNPFAPGDRGERVNQTTEYQVKTLIIFFIPEKFCLPPLSNHYKKFIDSLQIMQGIGLFYYFC